jgi:hypothetical protein
VVIGQVVPDVMGEIDGVMQVVVIGAMTPYAGAKQLRGSPCTMERGEGGGRCQPEIRMRHKLVNHKAVMEEHAIIVQ